MRLKKRFISLFLLSAFVSAFFISSFACQRDDGKGSVTNSAYKSQASQQSPNTKDGRSGSKSQNAGKETAGGEVSENSDVEEIKREAKNVHLATMPLDNIEKVVPVYSEDEDPIVFSFDYYKDYGADDWAGLGQSVKRSAAETLLFEITRYIFPQFPSYYLPGLENEGRAEKVQRQITRTVTAIEKYFQKHPDSTLQDIYDENVKMSKYIPEIVESLRALPTAAKPQVLTETETVDKNGEE